MSLWLADQPLVLASGSAVRRLLLEGAGIPIEIRVADIDERSLEEKSGLADPGAIAALLAREKALSGSAQCAHRLVLGADQTLALGERRFPKPRDRAAAREQLKALRGQTHELHAAVAIVRDTTIIFEHRDVARLTMRAFSDAFLESYLDAAGGDVTESVGAYQVEKAGIHLFERIAGAYFTILGLPLLPVLDFLRRDGALSG